MSSTLKPPAVNDLEAIINAPPDHVRSVLVTICLEDASLRSKTVAILEKLQVVARQHEASAEGNEHGSSAKRKRPMAADEIHLCTQCEIAFTTENNHARACTYHPGE